MALDIADSATYNLWKVHYSAGPMTFQADPGKKFILPEDCQGMFQTYRSTIDFGTNQIDASNVTNMQEMFKNAVVFNSPINDWKTSSLVNMQYMFYDANAFNQSLNNWDTSHVTNMRGVFYGADVFNQPLNNWNTSNVTNMAELFALAESFNQRIDAWDTSNVTNMHSMFSRARVFNQPLNAWDTSNVITMKWMFTHAEAFNQSLNDWDTSKVEDMYGMFCYTKAFNKPLNNWDTSEVITMQAMFEGTESFNQPLNNWDMGEVVTVQSMFYNAKAYNQLIDWPTLQADRYLGMLFGATSFTSSVKLDISSVDRNTGLISLLGGSGDDACPAQSLILVDNTPTSAAKSFTEWDYPKEYLKYFEFNGLKAFTLNGFSGDYIVEEIIEIGENIITEKDKDDTFDFEVHKHYKVYLQPLAAPQVSLSKAGNAIKVSWNSVPGATGYQVYRADKASGPFTRFKTTGLTSYTNSGKLVPGMPYYYKVRAYSKVGSTYSFGDFSGVKGYYAPGALAAPEQPDLSLDENAGGIRLNWDQQTRVTGYQVFRSVSPDKPFSYLKTASGNATKYTNLSGLTSGRPYYYKLRAYRMAKGTRAYSQFSDILGLFAGTDEEALGAVSFSLEDNPGVSAPNVRVRWSKVYGAGGYCVYRWNSAAQNWIGLKKTGPNARVYTNINGVANHKTNYYGMRPYHISGGKTYYGNIGKSKGFRVDK